MKKIKPFMPMIIFAIFVLISYKIQFQPGIEIFHNSVKFSKSMLKFIPAIFMLLGLFEVWTNREIIEKHLGEESGIRGYLWALALSASMIGGLHIAFPIAYSLYKKGASLRIIFAYISFTTVCRIPMNLFELSFMGIKFTLIRLLVSLPIMIIFSQLLSKYLSTRKYQMNVNE